MILLMGRSGAGKSSQGAELAKRHPELEWIPVGELLRQSREPEVVKAQAHGELVSDRLTTEVVIGAVNRLAPGHVPLLDGFPRRLNQVTQLELIMPKLNRQIKHVLYIKVSPETALRRLTQRGRADDVETAIKRRVEVFEKETLPVLEYYARSGIVSEIDGEANRDKVTEQMEAILGF